MYSLQRKIILGSNSPRRKEILTLAGFDFDIWSIDYEERLPTNMDEPGNIPQWLAEQKAYSIRDRLNDEILITADTLVFRDGYIMGKPKDREDAFQMLQNLSGRMHKVITGVCLMSKTGMKVFSDTSNVYFNPFDLKEIEYYLDSCNPMDKAGAYGAQDWLGLNKIEKIEGSYFNVMGLPIHKVYETLKAFTEHETDSL